MGNITEDSYSKISSFWLSDFLQRNMPLNVLIVWRNCRKILIGTTEIPLWHLHATIIYEKLRNGQNVMRRFSEWYQNVTTIVACLTNFFKWPRISQNFNPDPIASPSTTTNLSHRFPKTFFFTRLVSSFYPKFPFLLTAVILFYNMNIIAKSANQA